jgi:cytochrome c biogenesis protein CcmG/thiol:disulfide interchange protein DsbE
VKRAVALIAAAVAFAGAACSGGGSATPRAAVGKPAPTFSTYDLNGKRVRLVDYRGSLVILNFWASYCLPCRHEFPLLAQADARDRVTVLGVIYKDSAGNARKFMADHGGTWPGLKDDGNIARAYGVGQGIPVTILIGPGGLVLKRHLGEVRTLRELISDAEPS